MPQQQRLSWLAAPLAILLACPLAAAAQEPDHDAHRPPAAQAEAQPGQASGDMAAMMAKMMEARKQLAADLAKLDAELQTKVEAMQAARGEARLDAMAAVITTLAQQRTAIRERSMRMECEMMSGMMASDGGAGMKQKMMAGCAMMPAKPAAAPPAN